MTSHANLVSFPDPLITREEIIGFFGNDGAKNMSDLARFLGKRRLLILTLFSCYGEEEGEEEEDSEEEKEEQDIVEMERNQDNEYPPQRFHGIQEASSQVYQPTEPLPMEISTYKDTRGPQPQEAARKSNLEMPGMNLKILNDPVGKPWVLGLGFNSFAELGFFPEEYPDLQAIDGNFVYPCLVNTRYKGNNYGWPMLLQGNWELNYKPGETGNWKRYDSTMGSDLMVVARATIPFLELRFRGVSNNVELGAACWGYTIHTNFEGNHYIWEMEDMKVQYKAALRVPRITQANNCLCDHNDVYPLRKGNKDFSTPNSVTSIMESPNQPKYIPKKKEMNTAVSLFGTGNNQVSFGGKNSDSPKRAYKRKEPVGDYQKTPEKQKIVKQTTLFNVPKGGI